MRSIFILNTLRIKVYSKYKRVKMGKEIKFTSYRSKEMTTNWKACNPSPQAKAVRRAELPILKATRETEHEEKQEVERNKKWRKTRNSSRNSILNGQGLIYYCSSNLYYPLFPPLLFCSSSTFFLFFMLFSDGALGLVHPLLVPLLEFNNLFCSERREKPGYFLFPSLCCHRRRFE